VRAAWGKWDVVGLFNLRSEPLKVKVKIESLRLDRDRDYMVFEFWSRRLLGARRNEVVVTMKPLTTQLLCIREIPSHPMVLSTDMHFTQGGVDLPKVAWNERSGALTGVAKRQKGSRGNVYIYVPANYTPASGSPAVRRGVLTLPLRFSCAERTWQVSFRLEAE
jgi:hypothetical protein